MAHQKITEGPNNRPDLFSAKPLSDTHVAERMRSADRF